MVGFQSRDTLTNIGNHPWNKETGLLSLWVIGEFPASSETTVVIPIRSGSKIRLSKPLTSDYFGIVPNNRLSVRADVIFSRPTHRRCLSDRLRLPIIFQRTYHFEGSESALNQVAVAVLGVGLHEIRTAIPQ